MVKAPRHQKSALVSQSYQKNLQNFSNPPAVQSWGKVSNTYFCSAESRAEPPAKAEINDQIGVFKLIQFLPDSLKI